MVSVHLVDSEIVNLHNIENILVCYVWRIRKNMIGRESVNVLNLVHFCEDVMKIIDQEIFRNYKIAASGRLEW